MAQQGGRAVSGAALVFGVAIFVLFQPLLLQIAPFDLQVLNFFLITAISLALFFAMLPVFVRRGELELDGFGLRAASPAWFFLAGLGAVAVTFAVSLALGLLSGEGEVALEQFTSQQALARSSISFALSLLTLCLLAPVLEELVFRGLLQTFLTERLGFGLGLGLTSLLFALAHGQALAVVSSWQDQMLVLFALMLVGIAAGLLRHLSGSIFPAIALHAAYNGFVFANLQPLS